MPAEEHDVEVPAGRLGLARNENKTTGMEMV